MQLSFYIFVPWWKASIEDTVQWHLKKNVTAEYKNLPIKNKVFQKTWQYRLQCSVLQSRTKVRVCSFYSCNTAFYSSQCLIITPGHILITRDSNIQVSYTEERAHLSKSVYIYVCTWDSIASYSLQASLLLVDSGRPSDFHA